MPPLPVLAPDQVYPETAEERLLFRQLEQLTDQWFATAPTKVFGLRRWYALFAAITARLENATTEDGEPLYNWVPFESKAIVGKDIRAHADEYLAAWFEQNAGRYTVGLKVLKEKLPAPKDLSRAAADDIRELIEQASYAAVSIESIPDWFVSDDPIRELYDQNAEEWDEFATWLGAVTGVAMTEERNESRADQLEYAEDALDAERERARGLLDLYASSVDELERARKAGDRGEVDAYKETLDALGAELGRMGVSDPMLDPATGRRFPKGVRWEKRIDALLHAAFPDAKASLADPNVLRSELFDPDAFSIDRSRKTIVHTEAFRKRFAATYDERDSECVMRRAARAMWEYVKRAKRPTTERAKQDQYTMLYATMLQYVAWIFPCPEEIEQSLRERLGDRYREESKVQYLIAYNREIRDKLDLYDLGRADVRSEDLPEGAEQSAAFVAALFAAQDVERGIPAEAQIAEMLRTGVVRAGTRGGAVKLTRAQRKTVDDLLASEETRQLSDAEIAKRAGVTEDYVAERREQVGVVRRLGPEAAKLSANGRRTVVFLEPNEEPSVLYGAADSPERGPQLLLSPRCLGRCIGYMRNAERALPSPLQVIAAMTLQY